MNESGSLKVANIQRPFLEYRSDFNETIAAIWHGARHGEVVGAVLKALSPWQLGLENISWNQNAKNLAEAQVTFALPALFASIQLGIGGISASAINPDWSRRSLLVSLFQTAVDTLKSVVAQNLKSQQTTLGFHVMPDERPFRDTIAHFVNPTNLRAQDASMFGVSAYYSDFSFVIDASAVFPGGIFIKLNRTHSGIARFEKMAATLIKDEERILTLLSLKLQ